MMERPGADSYSDAERKFLGPFRALMLRALEPAVSLALKAGLTPNQVSLIQLPLGVLIVALAALNPPLAALTYMLTLLVDGLDGAMARRTGKASPYGAFMDQACDHIREITVIAGLAFLGFLNGGIAALFCFAYPAFNLILLITNVYGVSMPFAIKSWMVMYPGLILFFLADINVLDWAVGFSTASMGVLIAWGLVRLKGAMPDEA